MGSVRNVVDNTGAVIDTISYDGYGNITTETNPINCGHYKYDGYRHDSETALKYTWARYYDSSIGRWQSQDSLGLNVDTSLYRYVANFPTNLIDPFGLASKAECEAAIKQVQGEDWYKELKKMFGKCKIPEPECRANNVKRDGEKEAICVPGVSGAHSARSSKIITCYQEASAKSLVITIRHELIHALDSCLKRFSNDDFDKRALSACSELRAYMFSGGCKFGEKEGGYAKKDVSFSDCLLKKSSESLESTYNMREFGEFSAEVFVCCVWNECTRISAFPTKCTGFRPPFKGPINTQPLKRPDKCANLTDFTGLLNPL